MISEKSGDQLDISDVTTDKCVSGISLQRSKVLEISRVGKLVEVDDAVVLTCDPVENEVGTDKSGAAGNEDGGHSNSRVESRRSKAFRLLGI
jgi:hypothetical protein